MADRLEPVAGGERIVGYGRQIDNGIAEQSPVSRKGQPAGNPQFLPVFQILQRDIAVEPNIGRRNIGAPAAQRQVDFVAAHGKAILIQPEPVGEFHQPADLQSGAAHHIRHAAAKAGAIGKFAAIAVQAYRLADFGAQLPARPVQRIFNAIGDATAAFVAIKAGRAVQIEQADVFQFERPRILVGEA